MPIFQRRHYDQLAWWAGKNLTAKQVASLAALLAADNPAFRKPHFIAAYKARRALAELAQASYDATTHPKPVEANLDAIISSEK